MSVKLLSHPGHGNFKAQTQFHEAQTVQLLRFYCQHHKDQTYSKKLPYDIYLMLQFFAVYIAELCSAEGKSLCGVYVSTA